MGSSKKFTLVKSFIWSIAAKSWHGEALEHELKPIGTASSRYSQAPVLPMLPSSLGWESENLQILSCNPKLRK